MAKNTNLKSAMFARLNNNSNRPSLNVPVQEDNMNQNLRNTNASFRRVAGVQVTDSFETALNAAFATGDFAWDRPTYRTDTGEIRPVTEDDGAWLYLPTQHPMTPRLVGRLLAMRQANRYELVTAETNLDTAHYVIQTRSGIETYSGYPERIEVDFRLNADGFPVATTKFVSVRAWNGQRVAVETPADFVQWQRNFRNEQAYAILRRSAALALNEGARMEDLSPEQREIMAKVSSRDGRYWVPSVPEHNLPHALETYSHMLAQQYARSIGHTYRIGMIVAGASDLREATNPGTREKVMARLGFAARWYQWEIEAIAGKAPVDTVVEGAAGI